MEMYNPTPWWKRNFSLRYRRCSHQWEKITGYIDEGEQWYQVYCAKCETMMFFSKVGIQKLNRINEIREEYGETGARRHFFMFDVEEKQEVWNPSRREYETRDYNHQAYNELVLRRLKEEKELALVRREYEMRKLKELMIRDEPGRYKIDAEMHYRQQKERRM